MARRRRNQEVDIALGVAQLVALLVVAGMFVPQVRQMLLGLGIILLGAIILAGVVAFGVILNRRTQRKSPFDSKTGDEATDSCEEATRIAERCNVEDLSGN